MLDVAPPSTAPTPDRPGLHISGPLEWTAAGLLLAATVVGVVSLFPAYYAGQASLDTTAEQIVPVALVVAGWLAAGILVVSRRPALVTDGALMAVGIAVGELGLRIADFGQLTSGGDAGEGLWLFTAAWAAAAVGAVLAIVGARRAGLGGRPARPGPAPAPDRTVGVVAAAAGVLVGVAFIPSWDRYLVTSATDSAFLAQVTEGNGFHNPAAVIAGNVVVAVCFALVPIAAALWRPHRGGGALLAGTLVVVAGQLLSASAQVLETPSVSQAINLTPAQAALLLPRVTLHLTGWFDAELGGLLVLMVVAASRLHHHDPMGTGEHGIGYEPGIGAARGVEPGAGFGPAAGLGSGYGVGPGSGVGVGGPGAPPWMPAPLAGWDGPQGGGQLRQAPAPAGAPPVQPGQPTWGEGPMASGAPSGSHAAPLPSSMPPASPPPYPAAPPPAIPAPPAPSVPSAPSVASVPSVGAASPAEPLGPTWGDVPAPVWDDEHHDDGGTVGGPA